MKWGLFVMTSSNLINRMAMNCWADQKVEVIKYIRLSNDYHCRIWWASVRSTMRPPLRLCIIQFNQYTINGFYSIKLFKSPQTFSVSQSHNNEPHIVVTHIEPIYKLYTIYMGSSTFNSNQSTFKILSTKLYTTQSMRLYYSVHCNNSNSRKKYLVTKVL